MTRLFVFSWILINMGLKGFSSNSDWLLKTLTIKNGLSSNNILTIVEDYSGFIWIGTENGLNKFDGYKVSQYFKSTTDTSGLHDNAFVHLAIDKKGLMWIATRTGLFIYNPTLDKIQLASLTYNIHHYLNKSTINYLYSDSRGIMWVATAGDGVFAIDIDKKAYQNYHSVTNNDKYRISSAEIYSIAETHSGEILLSTDAGKLDIVDITAGTVNQINVKPNSNGSIELRKVYVDSKGKIWIGSVMEGLFEITLNKSGKIPNYNIKEWFSGFSIFDVLEDELGNIIAATENDGLMIIDKTSLISTYTDNPIKGQFLLSNSINALFKDRLGIIWIGTYNQGVNLFSRDKQKFQRLEHNPLNPLSLSHSSVSSMIEDFQGRILIGTDGGGLNLFNKVENSFKQLNNLSTVKDSKVNVVLYIMEDNKKDIWLATYGNGLVKLSSNLTVSDYFTNIPNNSNSIASNNIRYVYEDSEGNIWIANMEKGLDKYTLSNKQFTHYRAGYNDTISLSSNEITFIFEDKEARLFVGTVSGLNEFLPKQNIFNRINIQDDKNDYLADNHLISYFIDSFKNVWLGTKNGPIRFDSEKKYFEIVSHSIPSLKNTWIYSFLEDDNKNLWMGSNVGLIKFNSITNEISFFKSDDGLQSDEFSAFSAFKLRSGDMMFGGPNGMNIFNPKRIKNDSIPPKVVFTGFRVFNKSITAGNVEFGSVILNKEINQTEEISLTHKQKNFSIEFAAINYLSPEYVSYSYMLDGYDEAWISTDTQNRMATYTNLAPQEYTFRVKAANQDNTWSEERTIKITIQPAFYETLLFRISITVLIIAIGLLFYTLRTNSIRKQNIRLEQLVQQRTEELAKTNITLLEQTITLNETNTLLEEHQEYIEQQSEQLKKAIDTKDKFLSILAHDLKNPFNIVVNFSELLLKQYDSFNDVERKDNLGYIHKSSLRIYLLLENLLEWSKAQSKTIKYSPKAINLLTLVDDAFHVLEHSALSKNIAVQYSITKDFEVFADQHMINTVLRNFISNAIKFTNNGGSIYIKAEKEESFCKVRVIDTGVGMDENTLSKLFRLEETFSNVGTNGERGTGLGLSICKEFVLMHKGDIGVNSKHGQGSEFWFTLPLA